MAFNIVLGDLGEVFSRCSIILVDCILLFGFVIPYNTENPSGHPKKLGNPCAQRAACLEPSKHTD